MRNNEYNIFPLPVFVVSAKNGRILAANDLAQEKGIQANDDFYKILEDKALFSKIVNEHKRPVETKAVININNSYYYIMIHANYIIENGEDAVLMLLSKMEPISALNEHEIIDKICEAYIKNKKNPLYDFLRITAQSIGAFSASLYEKKNARYAICDEWRERKCAFVPMLSADFDCNSTNEMTRLRKLKRAEDMIYICYQKKNGTQGVAMYFFENKADDAIKDRTSKYIDVYNALAPDEPESILNAMRKGLERVEQSIGIWDAETKELLYQNKAFREKFGSGSAQLLERRFPKDYKPGAGPNLIYSGSAGRSFSMSHAKIRLGRRKLITTIVCDITRYKKAENRLEMLARTDALTGLNNRRAGLEMLDHAYLKCKKEGKPLTVCFADIDGLKKINDSYGHGVGDNMIRTVAAILKKELDGAGGVCRLGGDEFVLILPGYTKDQAAQLTSQIKKAVDRSFLNNSEQISVSFGFKEADYSAGETSSALLKIADLDMYKEKQRKA